MHIHNTMFGKTLLAYRVDFTKPLSVDRIHMIIYGMLRIFSHKILYITNLTTTTGGGIINHQKHGVRIYPFLEEMMRQPHTGWTLNRRRRVLRTKPKNLLITDNCGIYKKLTEIRKEGN